MPSQRAYHAIALLLEDGGVLSSGGNVRTWDHTIYEPKYFQVRRPLILSLTSTQLLLGPNMYRLTYDSFTYDGDEDPVEKVVLIRPGASTHSFDMDARYMELQQAPPPVPAAAGVLPSTSTRHPTRTSRRRVGTCW